MFHIFQKFPSFINLSTLEFTLLHDTAKEILEENSNFEKS